MVNHYFNAIIPTASGMRVFGTGDKPSGGSAGAWTMTIDGSGNFLDSVLYDYPDEVRVEAAVKAVDGGYPVVANAEPYDPGAKDLLLLETDANGGKQWRSVCNESYFAEIRTAHAVSDGGFMVGGMGGMGGGNRAMPIPLNADGSVR
jgi:hypothetical protein